MVNADAGNHGLCSLWEHAGACTELEHAIAQDGVMGDVRVGECPWRLHPMYPRTPNAVLCRVRTCWIWLLLQLRI